LSLSRFSPPLVRHPSWLPFILDMSPSFLTWHSFRPAGTKILVPSS
jgi:hypothetical protein